MISAEIVLADLPLNSMQVVELDGEAVLVANTAEGIFAISDTCSHAEVSLSEGELNGCFVECWMHGSAFDLRTGIPSTPPAIAPVEMFETEIQDRPEGKVVIVKSRKM